MNEKTLPKRKQLRLKDYDYSTSGAYFITVCVKNRKELLSKIIAQEDTYSDVRNNLSQFGKICDKYINNINIKYKNVTVDKYVIMPNHIHLILFIDGTMWASSPTKNALIPSSDTKHIESIIRSFKTMVTKEIGISIWQRSYNDHIIRNENDYREIWNYIDTNIYNWDKDCFYK